MQRTVRIMEHSGGTYVVVPRIFAVAMGMAVEGKPVRMTVAQGPSGPAIAVRRVLDAEGANDMQAHTSQPKKNADGGTIRSASTVVRIPEALALAFELEKGRQVRWSWTGPDRTYLIEPIG